MGVVCLLSFCPRSARLACGTSSGAHPQLVSATPLWAFPSFPYGWLPSIPCGNFPAFPVGDFPASPVTDFSVGLARMQPTSQRVHCPLRFLIHFIGTPARVFLPVKTPGGGLYLPSPGPHFPACLLQPADYKATQVRGNSANFSSIHWVVITSPS